MVNDNICLVRSHAVDWEDPSCTVPPLHTTVMTLSGSIAGPSGPIKAEIASPARKAASLRVLLSASMNTMATLFPHDPNLEWEAQIAQCLSAYATYFYFAMSTTYLTHHYTVLTLS